MQEVLHVQSVNTDLLVGLHNLFANEQGLSGLGCANAIHGETTRQTGDGSEETFKGLRQIVRDVVLVHLHHGDERRLCICERCLTTNADESSVVEECSNESSRCISGDDSISIDLQQEFVKGWVDADDVPDLMMHFKLQRAHREIVVDAVQEPHEKDLGVTFASVAWPRDFRGLADFDDNNERNDVALDFVQARIAFSHVVLLHALAQTFEAERVRVGSLWDA